MDAISLRCVRLHSSLDECILPEKKQIRNSAPMQLDRLLQADLHMRYF